MRRKKANERRKEKDAIRQKENGENVQLHEEKKEKKERHPNIVNVYRLQCEHKFNMD